MIKESFSLDSLELYQTDCCRWSRDNHICIVSRHKVAIYTLPFQTLSGSSVRRAKLPDTVGGASVMAADWSAEPIEGYHRLAVLLSDGVLDTFAPRMDPSWNTWRRVESLRARASCFAWHGDSIVYGSELEGRIVCRDKIVWQRTGRIPIKIVIANSHEIVAGWDDGQVGVYDARTEKVRISIDDNIWAVGPIVSGDFFAKLNKIYSMPAGPKELPTFSPVTGLCSALIGTADGHLYSTQTMQGITFADLRIDAIYGICEIPCGGYYAIVVKSKGQPVLVIAGETEAAGDCQVDNSSSLCERWKYCQFNNFSTVRDRTTDIACESEVVKKCSYCEALFGDEAGHGCAYCGAYTFRILGD